MCNVDFELEPYQKFVRNFLSSQTPYNGLLLFHGLGTGKTCSAISIAEETRSYYKKLGISKKIIVVSSPKVKENFKQQLFDGNKLIEISKGCWDIQGCAGNTFIKELSQFCFTGVSKSEIKKQIDRIISNHYDFMGYLEFTNLIEKETKIESDVSEEKKQLALETNIRNYFNDRLLIIDEVHNLRSDAKKSQFETLVRTAQNMKLLLLTATPMYNNYSEIITLINLLNLNDGREKIEVNDVFEKDGTFKIDKNGEEVGKEILIRKSRGYVSFVRGDNPYTFPYRIWPQTFSPEDSFSSIEGLTKPTIALNGKAIPQQLDILDVYLTKLGYYQQTMYNYLSNKLFRPDKDNDNDIDDDTEDNAKTERGMVKLEDSNLLQALNIVFPSNNIDNIDERENDDVNEEEIVGTVGLKNCLTFKLDESNPAVKHSFEYKEAYMNDEKGMFHPEEIGKYSAKIKKICDCILKSKGVVLVYSRWKDSGIIPLALALEELGITNVKNKKSLFKRKPNRNSKHNSKHKYIMITGDTPEQQFRSDLKAATSYNNKDGDKVKVILITQAGSEGIDFKFIRQVHIMEPWWNMSRIEQIIGRAVRKCSHKDLDFQDRNVEIYLHSSLQRNEKIESIDVYLYRQSEIKAINIGKITRALKETAVDCILNVKQGDFVLDKMNQTVDIRLSSKQEIETQYRVGDKPYSSICDYMEKCEYTCKPTENIGDDNVTKDTYNEFFVMNDIDSLVNKIKTLFKERFFYKQDDIIRNINTYNTTNIDKIYAALSFVIDNKEIISDKYDRLGTLKNIGDLYFFQPKALTSKNISLYERSHLIDKKFTDISIRGITNDEKKGPSGGEVFNQAKMKYDMVFKNSPIDEENLSKDQIKWYKIAKNIYEEMKNTEQNGGTIIHYGGIIKKSEITPDIMRNVVTEHILEELNFDDTLCMLNYLTVEKLSHASQTTFPMLPNPLPTFQPTTLPTLQPTPLPTFQPTGVPTRQPNPTPQPPTHPTVIQDDITRIMKQYFGILLRKRSGEQIVIFDKNKNKDTYRGFVLRQGSNQWIQRDDLDPKINIFLKEKLDIIKENIGKLRDEYRFMAFVNINDKNRVTKISQNGNRGVKQNVTKENVKEEIVHRDNDKKRLDGSRWFLKPIEHDIVQSSK